MLTDRTGTGRICHKLDFDVAVRGNRCIVDSVTKLTPAEAGAGTRNEHDRSFSGHGHLRWETAF